MTDEQDFPAEPWLCTICDDPMVVGQAFHGIRRSHWDCAQREPREPVQNIFSIVHPGLEMSLAPAVDQIATCAERPAPQSSVRGPTTADIRLASMNENSRQVESRPWAQVWRSPENGRTCIGLECPFCFEVVKAYVWSLPNGKRCPCGAFHGRLLSTHWRQPEPSQEASSS